MNEIKSLEPIDVEAVTFTDAEVLEEGYTPLADVEIEVNRS